MKLYSEGYLRRFLAASKAPVKCPRNSWISAAWKELRHSDAGGKLGNKMGLC